MACFAPAAEADLAAGVGEADGIGEQVVEHLRDAPAVGDELVEAGLDRDVERDMVLGQPLAHALHRLVDHVAHLDRRELQLERAGVDGGEVENVIDDGEQRTPRQPDIVEIFALLVGQGAGDRARQQLAEADDVGERRAQLVGDVADEGGLEPVGRLQRLVALDQRPLDALRRPVTSTR